MRAEDLLFLRPALGHFLRYFGRCCRSKRTRRLFHTYVHGQLGPLPRKSIEPMALDAGVPPRTLQELLSLHRWDEERMRERLLGRVRESHSGRHVIGVIDETGHPKKGDKTPGVQRQYCGATGKVDNCAVTVHIGLADADFHTLLESELYLPESWAADRARCRAARIPDAMEYRPKWRIALDLIDNATAHGIECGWFVFDEGYGSKPGFLAGLQERGHRYVAEVPSDFRGWLRAPRILRAERGNRGTGRPRLFPRLADGAPSAAAVRRLAARIPPSQRTTFHVKDTHKGPEVWHVAWAPFHPQIDGLPGAVHWLLVLTHAVTKEVKYFLSNASPGVPLEVLLHVAFSRWHVERCFEDQKGEIGLSHFEVRNYRSLKRHLLLSAVSFLFLAETNDRLRRGGKHRVDGSPDQAGDRSAA